MRGNNVAAMDCYMKDTEDPFHAFAFIDSMLSRHVSTSEGVVSFQSAVMSRVPDLVKLNRLIFFEASIEYLYANASRCNLFLHHHENFNL
jgi:vacuolar protein sorting-associated protein 8